MTDQIVKWAFIVVMAVLFGLLALLFGVAGYALMNHDKYECHKTGRQVQTIILSGNVPITMTIDETVCKRIAE